MNVEALKVEPAWITLARSFMGLAEVKGDQHNPEILQMWKDIKRSGIKSDEIPWCAGFVGAMLERSGIQSSRFESAKSYLDWGKPIAEPTHGCVVVLNRTGGGGHVGFVVGRSPKGSLLVLGGNQNDAVNIAVFAKDRVVGYRWPVGAPMPGLQLVMGEAPASVREA